MKKRVLCLIAGFLLIGINVFAADGDLIVNGNVGIGTSTPSEKLEVNGNVKASGFVGPGAIRQIQTINPTTDITTTSTTFVDMGGMSITLTTGDSKLLIFWNATLYSTAGNQINVETQVDGVRKGPVYGGSYGDSYMVDAAGGHTVAAVTAGSHTVKLRWKIGGGTAKNLPTTQPEYYGRTLTVIEVGQ
jgi:hypothetical protein